MKRFFMSFVAAVLIVTPFTSSIATADEPLVREDATLQQLEILVDDLFQTIGEVEDDQLTTSTTKTVVDAVEDERLIVQIPKNTIIAKRNVTLLKEEVVQLKRTIQHYRTTEASLSDAQIRALVDAMLMLRAELQQPTYVYGSIAHEVKNTLQFTKQRRWIAAHQSVERIAQLQIDQIAHLQQLQQSVRAMHEAF